MTDLSIRGELFGQFYLRGTSPWYEASVSSESLESVDAIVESSLQVVHDVLCRATHNYRGDATFLLIWGV